MTDLSPEVTGPFCIYCDQIVPPDRPCCQERARRLASCKTHVFTQQPDKRFKCRKCGKLLNLEPDNSHQ